MIFSTIEQGLIFAIMALGVYISYKVLDFPDLTVEGSFPLGGAIASSLLIKGANPVLALIFALIGGAIAGAATGYIHVKYRVTNLLSGIIVMTGLYSINLRVMGSSNAPLFNTTHLFSKGGAIIIIFSLLITIKLVLDLLLTTKFGFILRALGDNERLVTSLGVDKGTIKIIGLMLANSLAALSGGILVQYQGFSDAGMGSGVIVIGLASVILGDALFNRFKVFSSTTKVVIGALAYRGIIAIALEVGMKASDLKLITAVIAVSILSINGREKYVRDKKSRKIILRRGKKETLPRLQPNFR